MFQQLLANKHHRLRDTVPITIWPSGGLGLVTDKKKKLKKNNKSHAEQEPRSAHGRAVNEWLQLFGMARTADDESANIGKIMIFECTPLRLDSNKQESSQM